jgi:hypothetical protein
MLALDVGELERPRDAGEHGCRRHRAPPALQQFVAPAAQEVTELAPLSDRHPKTLSRSGRGTDSGAISIP